MLATIVFFAADGAPERTVGAAMGPNRGTYPAVRADSAQVDTLRADSASADTARDDTAAAAADSVEARAFASGEASYYGPGFAGRPTASGETFDPSDMTAAHRSLPFGTRLRVTNRVNGRSVVVRVNDRGPYAGDRILDLSQGAASQIGMVRTGTAHVDVEILV